MTAAFLTLAALAATRDGGPGIVLPRESDPLFRPCVEQLAAATEPVGEVAGRMPVGCSYCRDHYDEKPCASAMHGLTSHGICPTCLAIHFPEMKTAITHANLRAAIPSRRVCQELGHPAQRVVRARAAGEMEFGVHWVWRNGEEHYTPAGLRFLAEAHDRDSDETAAVVCRRLATEIEAAEHRRPAPVSPAADYAATDRDADTFAVLERRGLA